MKLLEQVCEREYLLLENRKKSNNPLFLYGNGYYTSFYVQELLNSGIIPQGIIVDDEYYTGMDEKTFKGGGIEEDITVKIFAKSCMKSREDKIDVLVCFYQYREGMLDDLRGIVDKIECYDFSCVSLFRFKWEYIVKHEKELQATMEKLGDEKSRELMVAYINQRISGDISYCQNLTVTSRYYDKSKMNFGEHEVFIDCGAFDGDSILEFVRVLRNLGITSWDSIYAFEPDAVNYSRLEKNLESFENIKLINKGAYSREDILHFEQDRGKSSNITTNGSVEIPVTTIDSIIGNNRATFIKMDIQGSELDALIGARKTIKRNKPKLAICLAHRENDLIDIVNFLHCLEPKYQFYLSMQETKYSDICLLAI